MINLNPALKNTLFNFSKMIPDEYYLSFRYLYHTRSPLNFNTPETFNDKINWLKLNWRDPRLPELADKIKVRKFIEEKVGKEYLNEVYGTYDSVHDIDLEALPDAFVLKTNHASGYNILCPDKKNFDREKEFARLDKWLKTDYYWFGREWVYKGIEPGIICEKYMKDSQSHELPDYKFFCFHGQPKFIQVDTNRFSGHKRIFFDLDWNVLPFKLIYDHPDQRITPPANLNKMIEIVQKLAEGLTFTRIDLYSVEDRIIFGEISFYPDGGVASFHPEKYNRIIGNYLNIDELRESYYNSL
jgi:hypothetical protein